MIQALGRTLRCLLFLNGLLLRQVGGSAEDIESWKKRLYTIPIQTCFHVMRRGRRLQAPDSDRKNRNCVNLRDPLGSGDVISYSTKPSRTTRSPESRGTSVFASSPRSSNHDPYYCTNRNTGQEARQSKRLPREILPQSCRQVFDPGRSPIEKRHNDYRNNSG